MLLAAPPPQRGKRGRAAAAEAAATGEDAAADVRVSVAVATPTPPPPRESLLSPDGGGGGGGTQPLRTRGSGGSGVAAEPSAGSRGTKGVRLSEQSLAAAAAAADGVVGGTSSGFTGSRPPGRKSVEVAPPKAGRYAAIVEALRVTKRHLLEHAAGRSEAPAQVRGTDADAVRKASSSTRASAAGSAASRRASRSSARAGSQPRRASRPQQQRRRGGPSKRGVLVSAVVGDADDEGGGGGAPVPKAALAGPSPEFFFLQELGTEADSLRGARRRVLGANKELLQHVWAQKDVSATLASVLATLDTHLERKQRQERQRARRQALAAATAAAAASSSPLQPPEQPQQPKQSKRLRMREAVRQLRPLPLLRTLVSDSDEAAAALHPCLAALCVTNAAFFLSVFAVGDQAGGRPPAKVESLPPTNVRHYDVRQVAGYVAAAPFRSGRPTPFEAVAAECKMPLQEPTRVLARVLYYAVSLRQARGAALADGRFLARDSGGDPGGSGGGGGGGGDEEEGAEDYELGRGVFVLLLLSHCDDVDPRDFEESPVQALKRVLRECVMPMCATLTASAGEDVQALLRWRDNRPLDDFMYSREEVARQVFKAFAGGTPASAAAAATSGGEEGGGGEGGGGGGEEGAGSPPTATAITITLPGEAQSAPAPPPPPVSPRPGGRRSRVSTTPSPVPSPRARLAPPPLLGLGSAAAEMTQEDFLRFARYFGFYPTCVTSFGVASILKNVTDKGRDGAAGEVTSEETSALSREAGSLALPGAAGGGGEVSSSHQPAAAPPPCVLEFPEFLDTIVLLSNAIFARFEMLVEAGLPPEPTLLQKVESFFETCIRADYPRLTGHHFDAELDFNILHKPVVRRLAPTSGWCGDVLRFTGVDFCVKRGVFVKFVTRARWERCAAREAAAAAAEAAAAAAAAEGGSGGGGGGPGGGESDYDEDDDSYDDGCSSEPGSQEGDGSDAASLSSTSSYLAKSYLSGGATDCFGGEGPPQPVRCHSVAKTEVLVRAPALSLRDYLRRTYDVHTELSPVLAELERRGGGLAAAAAADGGRGTAAAAAAASLDGLGGTAAVVAEVRGVWVKHLLVCNNKDWVSPASRRARCFTYDARLVSVPLGYEAYCDLCVLHKAYSQGIETMDGAGWLVLCGALGLPPQPRVFAQCSQAVQLPGGTSYERALRPLDLVSALVLCVCTTPRDLHGTWAARKLEQERQQQRQQQAQVRHSPLPPPSPRGGCPAPPLDGLDASSSTLAGSIFCTRRHKSLAVPVARGTAVGAASQQQGRSKSRAMPPPDQDILWPLVMSRAQLGSGDGAGSGGGAAGGGVRVAGGGAAGGGTDSPASPAKRPPLSYGARRGSFSRRHDSGPPSVSDAAAAAAAPAAAEVEESAEVVVAKQIADEVALLVAPLVARIRAGGSGGGSGCDAGAAGVASATRDVAAEIAETLGRGCVTAFDVFVGPRWVGVLRFEGDPAFEPRPGGGCDARVAREVTDLVAPFGSGDAPRTLHKLHSFGYLHTPHHRGLRPCGYRERTHMITRCWELRHEGKHLGHAWAYAGTITCSDWCPVNPMHRHPELTVHLENLSSHTHLFLVVYSIYRLVPPLPVFRHLLRQANIALATVLP